MFTIWQGEGIERKMLGEAAQTLEAVIGIIDSKAIERYEVCASGHSPRVWGYVTRNEDATFTIELNRAYDGTSILDCQVLDVRVVAF